MPIIFNPDKKKINEWVIGEIHWKLFRASIASRLVAAEYYSSY